jgi:hypothetical protein
MSDLLIFLFVFVAPPAPLTVVCTLCGSCLACVVHRYATRCAERLLRRRLPAAPRPPQALPPPPLTACRELSAVAPAA